MKLLLKKIDSNVLPVILNEIEDIENNNEKKNEGGIISEKKKITQNIDKMIK